MISGSSSRQDSAKRVLAGGKCCERREEARATTRGLCATVMQGLTISPSLLSLYHSINRLENPPESHRLLLLTRALHLHATASRRAPRAGPHSLCRAQSRECRPNSALIRRRATRQLLPLPRSAHRGPGPRFPGGARPFGFGGGRRRRPRAPHHHLPLVLATGSRTARMRAPPRLPAGARARLLRRDAGGGVERAGGAAVLAGRLDHAGGHAPLQRQQRRPARYQLARPRARDAAWGHLGRARWRRRVTRLRRAWLVCGRGAGTPEGPGERGCWRSGNSSPRFVRSFGRGRPCFRRWTPLAACPAAWGS